MIREFEKEDLEKVAEIWLNSNIKVHDFIKKDYWENNFETVKLMFLEAKIYVYEVANEIQAFIGLNNNYIEGIFVDEKMRSKGIGKALLDFVKQNSLELSLKVYKKNQKAIKFYQREGFKQIEESIDTDTRETEFTMEWKKSLI